MSFDWSTYVPRDRRKRSGLDTVRLYLNIGVLIAAAAAALTWIIAAAMVSEGVQLLRQAGINL